MSLFTVRMFRDRVVCSYDDRGRRCNERTERLEVVITDLPNQTALAYKFKFPKADVTITRQEGAADVTPRRRTSAEYYERPEETAPVEPKRDAIVEAAIRGDLGAAISDAA